MAIEIPVIFFAEETGNALNEGATRFENIANELITSTERMGRQQGGGEAQGGGGSGIGSIFATGLGILTVIATKGRVKSKPPGSPLGKLGRADDSVDYGRRVSAAQPAAAVSSARETRVQMAEQMRAQASARRSQLQSGSSSSAYERRQAQIQSRLTSQVQARERAKKYSKRPDVETPSDKDMFGESWQEAALRQEFPKEVQSIRNSKVIQDLVDQSFTTPGAPVLDASFKTQPPPGAQ